jgi:hypothetical protein
MSCSLKYHIITSQAGFDANTIGQMGFPNARGTNKKYVLMTVNKVALAELFDNLLWNFFN